MSNSKYRKTLVIDSSYMAKSIITTERSFVISYKGNADILNSHPESFKLVNPELDIKKPSIIRIYKYVDTRVHKVPLSRTNIYKRDNYECVYCGDGNVKTLTLDHVIPQSKGGPNTWNNLVTACKTCNSEKADLTLEEYGKEIPQPARPHYLMLIKKLAYIPEEWKPYLFF
jgi:5-methylcytosine-specific restriction endonuclease McrA